MNERTIATAILLSLTSLGTAGPASAQLRPPEPSKAFVQFRPAPTQEPPSSTVAPRVPDYRWEGLVVGAVALGGFSAFVYEGFCGDTDSNSPGCTAGGLAVAVLIGATIGGVTGGLLGGLIPKPTR